MNWAVATYDTAFGYVSAHGAPLVDLLDPQPDERIIDLGCGTGTFSAAIAERGATVLGIDGSPEMIAQAAATYPDLSFAVGDAHDFTTSEPYDAVASNAALHWMTRDPDAVINAVHAALRPGGRFVAEMGGAGNCAELIAAMQTAWRIFGLNEPELPWYFPTPAEYATRLENAGFTVRLLEYFDRPTRMTEGPNGAADWVRVFAAGALKEVPPEIVEPLLARINELAAPALRRESGWVADYVRLRFAAVRKPDGSTPMPEGPNAPGQGAPRGGAPSDGPVNIRTRPTVPPQGPGTPPPRPRRTERPPPSTAPAHPRTALPHRHRAPPTPAERPPPASTRPHPRAPRTHSHTARQRPASIPPGLQALRPRRRTERLPPANSRPAPTERPPPVNTHPGPRVRPPHRHTERQRPALPARPPRTPTRRPLPTSIRPQALRVHPPHSRTERPCPASTRPPVLRAHPPPRRMGRLAPPASSRPALPARPSGTPTERPPRRATLRPRRRRERPSVGSPRPRRSRQPGPAVRR
ncbi:class I SAM-dependent methyltransferase [Thermomonospora amylolytica]|uniref:class I SAM-dependent methyltransferase n=1 Tax=Thermomonospora amylolytica TaxID=1411117 RepID=UPI002D78CFBF|nr:methyltransferase domain-containing protein [Thermomonospora amylolytica]